ncbi:IS30 family transposase [Glaciihabitans sp. dw_435]|uniref:IS30 family transposase n=1 Tax=Glaciihabitans sp. dw_435 TaxID=2720081 RepID=UPI0035ABD7B2
MPSHLLRPLSGRYLGPVERVMIQSNAAVGMSVRASAAVLGRSPSTVSRELLRGRRLNGIDAAGGQRYQPYNAVMAQARAERRGLRPQAGKLSLRPELRRYVQKQLNKKWSPEQISKSLVVEFPSEELMRVSHETIYHSIYLQTRGSLKKELVVKLRTGRTLRKSHRGDDRNSRGVKRIPGMVNIAERPAEVDDRAVPGHWEGDLIVGTVNGSQIGTLVERTTRYCMLVHLPGTRSADVMAEALIATMKTLPAELAKTLTWDQGIEMAKHATVSMATDMEIYFCDPHSPWQRGSNENTNGLLRQYFPKGTDLSVHSKEHLEFVARELNGRPRKTLGWKSPAQAFSELLLGVQQTGVATTP